MIKIKMLTLVIIAGLLLTGCSKDDGPATEVLTIETIGLKPLTGGTSYQGWLVVDGEAKPTERFTNPGTVNLSVVASDLEDATEFLISIEPVNDTDPESSGAIILKGKFNGTSAPLDFSSVVADLSNTSGQFVLYTPTDESNDNDEFGVWFQTANGVGLNLPVLGKGWKYEGWVDFNGKKVSTGTFSKVDAIDDANFFKGSGGTIPPYPGEDFLIIPNQIPLTGVTFPGEVTGKEVFITIEPFQDRDPAPFFIKPLRANASITTGLNNPVEMNSDNAVPSGRVTRPSF
ncbi:anti-sigma factor [Aquimarina sp. W85]|uniref:anti-sigma factor n=1 Tax=Aquimarina rhodophyticola TaxID=3342246 RepID=UPI003671519C